jgi:hypothetical protein
MRDCKRLFMLNLLLIAGTTLSVVPHYAVTQVTA